MIAKIHKSYRDVVGICDKELLGKRFEEGKFQLDVKESFFKDKELTSEQAQELFLYMSAEDATFNIIGKKSTDMALKVGVINKEGINTIDGIPFALILA